METIRQRQQGGSLHPVAFPACGNRGLGIPKVPISSHCRNGVGNWVAKVTDTNIHTTEGFKLETTLDLAYRVSVLILRRDI